MFPLYDSYLEHRMSFWLHHEPLVSVKDTDNIRSPKPDYEGKSRRHKLKNMVLIRKKKNHYAKLESIRKDSRKKNRK